VTLPRLAAGGGGDDGAQNRSNGSPSSRSGP